MNTTNINTPLVKISDDAPADSAQNNGASRASASEMVVMVRQAEPAKDVPDTPIIKFKAWYLAIAAGLVAYLSATTAWAKDSPINLVIVLLVIAGAIVVVYIVCNLLIKNRRESRENELKLQREKQAHVLTLIQMKSAMKRDVNTIRIVPNPVENSDQ